MKKFKNIYVEITNRCNLNCSFCSKNNKTNKEMTLDEVERVLQQIEGYTDYIYLHVKGEPFLHTQLKEVLELCKKYKKKVNITTNGTVLLNQVPVLLEMDVVRQINISLHANESDDPSYLNNILRATQILLDKTNIHIVYRYWTLTDKKLEQKHKNTMKTILDYFQVSQEKENEIERQDNVVLKPFLYVNKDNKFEWPNLNHKIETEKGTCYGLRKHIAILADGSVVPCCLDSDGIITIGNIYNQTLSEILHSDRAVNMKRDFENKKIKEELCQKCSYRTKFER